MAAPDPAYVRMFNARRDWARDIAKQQAKNIARDVEALQRDLERGDRVTPGQARALADAAVQLVERLAALEALDEVSYLTARPDNEEA